MDLVVPSRAALLSCFTASAAGSQRGEPNPPTCSTEPAASLQLHISSKICQNFRKPWCKAFDKVDIVESARSSWRAYPHDRSHPQLVSRPWILRARQVWPFNHRETKRRIAPRRPQPTTPTPLVGMWFARLTPKIMPFLFLGVPPIRHRWIRVISFSTVTRL